MDYNMVVINCIKVVVNSADRINFVNITNSNKFLDYYLFVN